MPCVAMRHPCFIWREIRGAVDYKLLIDPTGVVMGRPLQYSTDNPHSRKLISSCNMCLASRGFATVYTMLIFSGFGLLESITSID